MIYELQELLDSLPDRTFILLNPFVVNGVELDTVWWARCLGITRLNNGSYNVILKGTKQFYRPMSRTSIVFQYNLMLQVRLTLINKISFSNYRCYIY